MYTNGTKRRIFLALDTETIYDTSVLHMLLDKQNTDTQDFIHNNALHDEESVDDNLLSDESQKRLQMENYHLNITNGKNPFPRQLFHRLVAICAVKASADTFPDTLQKNGFTVERIDAIEGKKQNAQEDSEKSLLRSFAKIMEDFNPTIVTFNGRGFDLPVIKYRAMKHGVQMKSLTSKNYSYRYDTTQNCDLIEVLSDFGASARISLLETCALLSIPCKIDFDGMGYLDGSKVADEFDAGRLSRIEKYCALDALGTFIAYIRYLLLCGTLNIDGYNNTIRSIENYIAHKSQSDANDYLHLTVFLAKWKEANQGDIYL